MGLFDRFRKSADTPPPPEDEGLRKGLVELVFAGLRDKDGRIRVEDAVSAAATIVAERCIDASGDFSLRDHEHTPGSLVLSAHINELICGDTVDPGQIPADSIIGILRARLGNSVYSAADYPDMEAVFKLLLSGVGSVPWGRVPLSAPEGNQPLIQALRVGFETRPLVDKLFTPLLHDKRRCLKLATEALADILTMVASAIDHRLVLAIAIETINGMAKTAPMTERAMRQAMEQQTES